MLVAQSEPVKRERDRKRPDGQSVHGEGCSARAVTAMPGAHPPDDPGRRLADAVVSF